MERSDLPRESLLEPLRKIVGQIQHTALLDLGEKARRLSEGGVIVNRQFVDGLTAFANCEPKVLEAANVDIAKHLDPGE